MKAPPGETAARAQGLDLVTRDRLLALMAYDRETGVLRHRVTGRGKRVGAVAGTRDPDGYVVVQIDCISYRRHRLVWFLEAGDWPSGDLDHHDGVPGHDWYTNLRPATKQQNMQNRRCPKNNTSGVLGAFRNPKGGRWTARIGIDGGYKHLGCFDTAREAGEAYRKASLERFGEFSPHARPQ